MRIRLIPLTIITAMLFMAVKVTDVLHGTEAVSDAFFISKVEAKDEEKDAPAKEKSDGKKEEKKESKEKPSEKKEMGANPNVSKIVGSTTDRTYSKIEMELLQNLAKRREELRRWEVNIQVKEAALDATEKRIKDKITQIEAMRRQVSALLEQYNQQEDVKIKSLVRIYENMKAKDAARIFDEIEMPVLLIVIDKMAEKKAAPILAQMSPKKAKQVTVKLAAERQINNAKFNTLTSE